jgi:hypothetical protein
MLISPSALIDSISHRITALGPSDLAVFWFQVTSDREVFKRALAQGGSELGLVPLVIRGDGFSNPNAMLSDLARLIEFNRAAFDAVPGNRPTVITLLSAMPLQVPQLASPVVLPEWFPRLGGTTVHVIIEDLTYTADAAVNHTDIHTSRIAENLWRLERVLIDRLSEVHGRDHRRTNALLNIIRSTDAGITIAGVVEASRAYRSRCLEPGGFRPSIRDRECFVARLVLMFCSSSPDELPSRCAALSDALNCAAIPQIPTDSLPALLFRPTRKDPSNGVRVARNLISTIYASIQLMNAAAHSGEYGRYPVLLLKSCAHDLCTALGGLGDSIERLSGVTNLERPTSPES